MLDVSTLSTIILGGGGLVTGAIALYSAKSNKSKVNSEALTNTANAETLREKLYQSRELFWRNEINELKAEVSWLRTLIEHHVLWDWEVVRTLKLAGIDFPDPPTLNYIHNGMKPEEA